MIRRKTSYICILLLCLAVLVGCEKKDKADQKGPFIYYINADASGFEKIPVKIQGDSTVVQAKNLVDRMSKVPKDASYMAAIPKQVDIYALELSEDNKKTLNINFSEGYNTLDQVDQVLMRESLVRTLTQIKGVDGVVFLINGELMCDKEGKTLGEVTKESFLRDTGSALHSYNKTVLTLYYPDAKGKNLIAVERNVRYRSNVSIEKAVVQELKKNPHEKDMIRTLPKNVKVLSVSLKDGICYVNFDEKFLDAAYKAQPEVVIYSMVNSIIDEGMASEVQFFVNGEKDIKFQEKISLKEPFDRNLDLLPEGGKSDSR